MKKLLLFLIANTFLLLSCSEKTPETSFIIAAWTGGDIAETEEEWHKQLDHFSSNGLTDLFLSTSPEETETVVNIADDYNMNIHAWVWTLNRPGDTTAAQHAEWYAVNRNGDNSYDYRAYVDYYQWLSPFSEGAREYIKSNMSKYAKIPGLTSVHLDYVRYVDVILGADLQPKYDLVQDRQFPEYDYGYHPNARREFKDLFGVDPLEMEHPELSMEWLQFRLNAVTSLVNEIAEIVHNEDKMLTAAVFPFPEMSRQMVRQDWASWDLDIALPMLYQNFYRQNLEWIQFSTEQGVREAHNRFDIVAGLYIPALNPDELQTAVQKAKAGGATGISVFDINALSEEHWKVLGTISSRN
ncbi:MAG: family 10 glycosylhydrolase [Gracilimonas sp.]|uniref:family 10 glycosylhydrolase n=1 Tax=Gracilimonas TaxID=649462 RepID=UPI001B1AA271|nr:family 10 glycosylhydrolase [Gracilimonas sp.]MBO6587074.1 family 10 glycosylhydrolase [Gracilimonas sp.]MBO6614438.1 family 10 glycosylhydrolase [Gracilimonas sp.]